MVNTDEAEPVLTFGSGEEKVVGAVHAQDGLAVALRHVHALQSGRAAALRGRHGVNDAPGTHNTHVSVIEREQCGAGAARR